MLCYPKHSSPISLQGTTVIAAGFQPCLPVCHAASLLIWRVRPVASKLRNAQFRLSPSPLVAPAPLGKQGGEQALVTFVRERLDVCLEMRGTTVSLNYKGNLEKVAEMNMLNEM